MKKRSLAYTLFCCWLLTGLSLQAQNQAFADSLQHILESDIEDRVRVDVYRDLAGYYQKIDSGQTAHYVQQALKLAQEIGYTTGTIAPLYPMGVATMHRGDFEKADQLFTEMAHLAAEHHYPKGKANAYYGLGWLSAYRGTFDRGLADLSQAAAIYDSLGNIKEEALCYNIIGIIYDRLGTYTKALESYFRALELNQSIDRKVGMASCYTNIGIIYKNQGSLDKAHSYHQQALELNQALGRQAGMASNYSNLGAVSYRQEQYDQALAYYQQSLAIKEQLQNQRGMAASHVAIGQVLLRMNDFSLAREHLLTALETYESIHSKADRGYALIFLGEAYRRLGQFSQARKTLMEGIALAQQTGQMLIIRDGSLQLAQAEEELGNYQAAYEAHVLYKTMSDSIDSEEAIRKITLLEAEYEFQKERDSLQYAQEQELRLIEQQSLETERRKQVIYVVVCLLLTVAIASYLTLDKIKQRRKLRSLRNRISQDLHDEIGSTLSSISLFGIVADKAIEDDPIKAHQLLGRINSYATQTIESMNDIVWALKTENDSLSQIVNRMRGYASELEDTGAWDFEVECSETLSEVPLDMIQRRNVYLIFKEAVNNAVKYSQGNSIQVVISPQGTNIRMEIRDNGQGFDLNSLTEDQLSLGGNGLKNLQRRAEELDGTLSILSQLGAGTQVILEFNPKHRPQIH